MTSRSGDLLDQRYLLVERLGSGGTGEVWRGVDHQEGREIALKLLHHQHLKAPTVRERFTREAKILTSLHHPNIARALAWSESHDPPYIALEFIQGIDLGEWLSTRARNGPKPTVEEVDALAQALFDALEYAHDQGVVHRDLKPANVMLESPGGTQGLKIVDFGIAKIVEGEGADSTTSGRTLGTFTYLAPEQLDASGADHRADIFALGTLLFELLTLHRAWMRDLTDRPIHCLDLGLKGAPLNAPVEVMRRILTGSRPLVSLSRRDLPNVFDQFVSKAMAVRRQERFDDIKAMRAAWDLAAAAGAPGRIVRRKESTHTPSMKATEVIMTELPPVMPQTMVIVPGDTAVWTRDATDATPKDGTVEMPGSKTNTDPVRVFPGEISDLIESPVEGRPRPPSPARPTDLLSGAPTQPPKRSSNPPARPLEAPPLSISNPAGPTMLQAQSLSAAPPPSRRFDFLAGSVVLSATILIVTLLIIERLGPPRAPVAAPAPAAVVAPTVAPAATALPTKEEPPPAPIREQEPRPRRRSAPKPPPPEPTEAAVVPEPPSPLRATLARLRTNPSDANGRLDLGNELERQARARPSAEQSSAVSACVAQSRLASGADAALQKLGECLDKLEGRR